MRRTVVVFSGGPGPAKLTGLPAGATVIAANGGAELACALGLKVDLAVGDLDSVSPGTLATVASVERHPATKDATDLELALGAAMRLEPERVLVVGSDRGRLDHLLGALLLLASDAYAAVQVDAQLGEAVVHVIRHERVLLGAPGELVSLFAVHGRASGVFTRGLLYQLQNEAIEPGSSRGISNVFTEGEALVAVERGVLLAVRPSSLGQAGT
jgi:thiamine pyrophosphokinase